jgi:hypothetical protein
MARSWRLPNPRPAPRSAWRPTAGTANNTTLAAEQRQAEDPKGPRPRRSSATLFYSTFAHSSWKSRARRTGCPCYRCPWNCTTRRSSLTCSCAGPRACCTLAQTGRRRPRTPRAASCRLPRGRGKQTLCICWYGMYCIYISMYNIPVKAVFHFWIAPTHSQSSL